MSNNKFKEFEGKDIYISLSDITRFKTVKDYLEYNMKELELSLKGSKSYDKKLNKNIEYRRQFIKEYPYFTDGFHYYMIDNVVMKDTIDYVNVKRIPTNFNLNNCGFIAKLYVENKCLRWNEIDLFETKRPITKISKDTFMTCYYKFNKCIGMFDNIHNNCF